MTFVADRYLLIATELGNYYVKVSVKKLLLSRSNNSGRDCKESVSRTTMSRLDENIGGQQQDDSDAASVLFMTSHADDNQTYEKKTIFKKIF